LNGLIAKRDIDQERAEIRAIEREIQRRAWLRDPVLWAQERLGDQLWSAQKRILHALRAHRKVAVMSCHEIGKSYVSGVAVGWWLDVHPAGQAFAITSAPSEPQVKAILWKEIGRVHLRGRLAGRINQKEWLMNVKSEKGGSREEQVGIGRKPNDYDFTAFQGLHARYFLYVFDEACGMPTNLWEAADSLAANDNSRGLAIGNPDDPSTEFARICKPGSGWHVIQVGAFDTPTFTGEPISDVIRESLIGRIYVEEKRRRWAPNWYWVDKDGQPCTIDKGVRVVCPEGTDPTETGSFWQSKVLGLFPSNTEAGGLIPVGWLQAAQQRWAELEGDDTGVSELGVDVGGGGDSSTIAHKKGMKVKIVNEDRNPDTMHTCGLVIDFLKKTGSSRAKIDMIGIGRGVVDRGKELKQPFIGIDVGKSAFEAKTSEKTGKKEEDDDEGYQNLRAQLWWHTRRLFEKGLIALDPADEDTASELLTVRYKRMSNGRIQIESKKDAEKRGVPSPNRAEAVMLACAPEPPKIKRATWGR
jgi:hypothetical protein